MAELPASWHLMADAGVLACRVAERIRSLCAMAVDDHGVFHWALAGGSTPRRCYKLLRTMPLEWEHVHLYFSDERCLPAGDAERNDTMAQKVLFSHVPVPPGQIHPIPAELGPEKGAATYAEVLADTPVMDLVLLGIGEDGHTASLFPGNPALEDKRLAVPVFDSPKPPPERVSMGYSALNGAARRIVMVAGGGKHEALLRIKNGQRLPAACLEESEWYVDAEAAGAVASQLDCMEGVTQQP